MTHDRALANRALEHLIELLDIPEHYYALARNRYQSLADWFHRDGSSIVGFDPSVYPQGSFRLGTVIRPLLAGEEYDLDLVAALMLLSKADLSQSALKKLLGDEIRAYAAAKGIKSPVAEKNRCWRLDYADEVCFHMDVLPAVPEDDEFKRRLAAAGIPIEQTTHAIAITDKKDAGYSLLTDEWPRSNPKGYALWFESRMRSVARRRRVALVERRVYASIDDVPAHEWKTPMQRAIQILKRHRDVMFRDRPELKPISIVISTLSASAYQGEPNLFEAISGILDRMPEHVGDCAPWVPNPVNPAEDFADKWSSDDRLARSFWEWHTQASADIARLAAGMSHADLVAFAQNRFDVRLADKVARDIAPDRGSGATRAPFAPVVVTGGAPKPWARDG